MVRRTQTLTNFHSRRQHFNETTDSKKKDNTNAGCKFHFTHTSTLNTCSTWLTWHRAGWTFISVSAWMRDVSMMLLNTIFMALKMSPRASPRAPSSWLLYHQTRSCDMRSCFTWPSTNCPIVAFNNLGIHCSHWHWWLTNCSHSWSKPMQPRFGKRVKKKPFIVLKRPTLWLVMPIAHLVGSLAWEWWWQW